MDHLGDTARNVPGPDESANGLSQTDSTLAEGLEQKLWKDEVRAQGIANEIILAHEREQPEKARESQPPLDIGRASLVEEILKTDDMQHPTDQKYWQACQLVAILQDTSHFPFEPT